MIWLAGCAGPDAPDSGAAWSAGPALPAPAQETAAAVVDGRVLVLGGFDGSAAIVPDVRAYDGAWTPATPMPAAVHHANAAAVDGRAYVVGALIGPQFATYAGCHVLDGEAWSDCTPDPGARGAAVTAAIDGTIYVAGGWRDGEAVADLSAWIPGSDTWDDLAPMPAPRDHACGGAIDGVLIVAGGREIAIDSRSDRVFRYDPATDTWDEAAPMPTARGGAACGVIGGELVVAGGEGNPDDDSGVFAQVEAYDPVADTWRALPDLPTPRHGMAAGVIEGRLIVPGGATVRAFGATDVVEVLTLGQFSSR